MPSFGGGVGGTVLPTTLVQYTSRWENYIAERREQGSHTCVDVKRTPNTASSNNAELCAHAQSAQQGNRQQDWP